MLLSLEATNSIFLPRLCVISSTNGALSIWLKKSTHQLTLVKSSILLIVVESLGLVIVETIIVETVVVKTGFLVIVKPFGLFSAKNFAQILFDIKST